MGSQRELILMERATMLRSMAIKTFIHRLPFITPRSLLELAWTQVAETAMLKSSSAKIFFMLLFLVMLTSFLGLVRTQLKKRVVLRSTMVTFTHMSPLLTLTGFLVPAR